MRSRWLAAAFALSVIVASVHYIAIDQYLYWLYPWSDVPMHYVGGLTIGTFLVALSQKFRPRAFVVLIVLALIGWEAFEYVFGIPRDTNYAFDTALDLLMGSLGAMTAYVVARFSLWRSV